MKGVFIQGFIMIALFFSLWFALTQIDWTTILEAQKRTDEIEEKLGNLFLDIFKSKEVKNVDPFVQQTVDSIVIKICSDNNINKEGIKVHILNQDHINAFALPGGHLVIFSGLILASDSPEELSGVIGHEIAHIQLNHVMKKLIKEVGLATLISMTTGNADVGVIKKTAKMLTSSAFDRKLEKQADVEAVNYMLKAKINPLPFADFLYKLSSKKPELMHYLSWINTHPDLKERAAYIVEYSKGKSEAHEPLLTPTSWDRLKEKLNTE